MNIESNLKKHNISNSEVYYDCIFIIPEELKSLKELKSFKTLDIIVYGEKGTAKYKENLLMANYIMTNFKEFVFSAIHNMIKDGYINKFSTFNSNLIITFNTSDSMDFEISFYESRGAFKKRNIIHYYNVLFHRNENRQINWTRYNYTHKQLG